MESKKEDPTLLDQCIVYSVPASGPSLTASEEFLFPPGSALPARLLNFVYPELGTSHHEIQYAFVFSFCGRVASWPDLLALSCCSPRAFYFSLTNELGGRIFLTCKRSTRWCVIIVSRAYVGVIFSLLPPLNFLQSSSWFDTSEYIIDTLWGKLPDWNDCTAICAAAARTPASLLRVREGEITLNIAYPERSPLRMTLPAQGAVSPTSLLRCLSVSKIISVVGALLKERRVLFVAKDLHVLTSGIWAILALLGPLQWQHVLIPVLPNVLINYCAAPMPFVLGILQDQIEAVRELPLEEVFFVYLDENRCVCVDVDDDLIIPDTVAALKNTLSQAAVDTRTLPQPGSVSVSEQMHRDFRITTLVSEAIDEFWASSWIGQYRRFIVRDTAGQIVFDKQMFIKLAPKRLHLFLETVTASQMWDHFILDRERLVDAQAPFPPTSFENLVNAVMSHPLPDGNASLGNLKSFFKSRLDKAAKLALEYAALHACMHLELSHVLLVFPAL